MSDAPTTVGSFACASGVLLVCDTAPAPSLVDAAAFHDGSGCLHIEVRPGRYTVEYIAGEDGPESIPDEVWVRHETAAPSSEAPRRRLRLRVEGGRIALMDRARAAEPGICADFIDEAADTIHHDCGLVISTWGDGEYPVDADGNEGPASVLRIRLDESAAGQEVAPQAAEGSSLVNRLFASVRRLRGG